MARPKIVANDWLLPKNVPVFGSMYDLHPDVKARFLSLHRAAAFPQFNLMPFETLRSPARQRELLNRQPPVTKVPAWESAHQYGLAVDYVHYDGNTWSWNAVSAEQWQRFHTLLDEHGLAAPISWDPGHVQPKEGWKQLLAEFLLD